MAGFIRVECPCVTLLRWLDISEKKTVNREIPSRVDNPGPTASVEWRLLLAGSSADAGESDFGRSHRLELQEAEGFDWELVLRLAEDHGTSSLLYQNLASSGEVVPAAVLASLRQRYETNVRKSLFLARELMRILDCTDLLGVEVIPYKGIALSEVYYRDIALRQSGDIDLFVRKRDVARIKSAVCDLGYAPRFTIPEDAEKDYIKSGYEWTFDSAAGKNLLELQWALQPRFYSVDFDMDGLFDRAANTMVAGRRVKTLSSEDLLLVLAVHAAKHVWGRLIWLCDIAQILKRGNLNWDFVQARAREFGIERILHVTLLLTNRFLTTKIPPAVERATREDRGARVFADEIEAAVANGVSYEEHKISYFRLMLRLRERRVDRFRFLTRLTFTPGPGEWEALHLPKLLFPLYRVVRMARLATRWAKN
jgi:putative nucleotidyltransferase-like protein